MLAALGDVSSPCLNRESFYIARSEVCFHWNRDMMFGWLRRKFGLFSFPRQGQETLQGRGAFGKASFARREGKAVVFAILERSESPWKPFRAPRSSKWSS